jgi:predicted DNA-binding transcriptional regulator AlpA
VQGLALSRVDLVLLNSKTTAALIGVSISTLEHARSDQWKLDMPPARQVGKRGVAYALGDVLRWAARRKFRLRWQHLPLRYALWVPEVYETANLPTPEDLLLRLRAMGALEL